MWNLFLVGPGWYVLRCLLKSLQIFNSTTRFTSVSDWLRAEKSQQGKKIILEKLKTLTKSKTLHLRVSFIFLFYFILIYWFFLGICLHQICLFSYCVKGVCNQWVCGYFIPPTHTVIMAGLSFCWARSELNCLSGVVEITYDGRGTS